MKYSFILPTSALLIGLLCGPFTCAIAFGLPTAPLLIGTDVLDVSNGRLEAQGGALRWHINNGQTSTLEVKPRSPFFDNWRDYGQISFKFKVASGEISSLDFNARGQVNGPREHRVHNWNVAVVTTPRGPWHFRSFELARPNWMPWNESNENLKTTTGKFLRLEALALLPNSVIELQDLRLVPTPILLKPDFELPVTHPIKADLPGGDAQYSLNYEVLNASGSDGEITAKVVSTHSRFKIAVKVDRIAVAAGNNGKFGLTAVISAADIADTPELYAEPLMVEFALASMPQAPWTWSGNLVRPLSPGFNKQVVVDAADVDFLRAKVAAADETALKTLDWKRLQSGADTLVNTRLLRIPGGHLAPANNPQFAPGAPGNPLVPGAFMPEAINEKANFREAFTPLTDRFWKEYLGYFGGTERLGQTYLLSNDEKYAQKAVELFGLYADQYPSLPWGNGVGASFVNGPTILAASRVSTTSSYGSNWLFKWHCKLLAMTANSPQWTPQIKNRVYQGWALPYAMEIAKFLPGVSNMTDITHHNLLLLGLFFDDATMVHRALVSDAGLITRLNDISADGFSAEGRPINYQYAGMDEYIPALTYLQRSGLKVAWPKEKLLRAFKMPYQRSSLWGQVPASGDSGRWQVVNLHPLADQLLELFPEEKNLAQVGRGSTLAAKRYRIENGPTDKEGWKILLETEPRLFPDAGLAVLRTGTTPETQIMATLDYGRNVFHAALDRNQFSLLAFGKTFTQGVGSTYNAGSGGMERIKDPKLESFVGHGSLGHNVILVDGLNQLPAIGKLLAYSSDPKRQVAVAQVDGIAPGVSHTRGLVLIRGLVVLLDRVSSTENHTYDWAFHSLGALQIMGPYSASEPTTKWEGAANYENVLDLRQLAGTGPLALSWSMADQIPAPTLWPKDAKGVALAPAAATQELGLHQLPPTGVELTQTPYTGVTGMNNPNTLRVPDRAPSLFRRITGKSFTLITVLEPRNGAASQVKAVAPVGEQGVSLTLASGPKVVLDLQELIQTGIKP